MVRQNNPAWFRWLQIALMVIPTAWGIVLWIRTQDLTNLHDADTRLEQRVSTIEQRLFGSDGFREQQIRNRDIIDRNTDRIDALEKKIR